MTPKSEKSPDTVMKFHRDANRRRYKNTVRKALKSEVMGYREEFWQHDLGVLLTRV